MVQDQLGRNRQSVIQKGRIDAAFKTLTCVAGQCQFLAGTCDMLWVEKGTLNEDVGRSFGNTAMFAAHDAANVMHHCVVRNHGHACVKRIGFAVERDHLLTVDGLAGHKRTVQLIAVIDVQRTAKINRHKVRDIDEQ